MRSKWLITKTGQRKTYNPVGTIATWTQQADSSTAVVNTLTYDNADQLTSERKKGTGMGQASFIDENPRMKQDNPHAENPARSCGWRPFPRAQSRQTSPDVVSPTGGFFAVLELLAQSISWFDVELWGYCLMGNHWHLAVSVEKQES